MDKQDQGIIIPVIREEPNADAVPVATGGVRVTKRLDTHDEIIEQELRKSYVDVKRVKTERVVDGPQPAKRVGKTLIIPVVSEVLQVQKQWMVTEEIHITETEAKETVQNRVKLNREEAEIERFNSAGNIIAAPDNAAETRNQPTVPTGILHCPATAVSS